MINVPLQCSDVRASFNAYLTKEISPSCHQELRNHLDGCSQCWQEWNSWRWERSKDNLCIIQLRKFLGAEFKYGFDSSWALANEWNNSRRNTVEEVEDFYKKTENYLYNLAIWDASGNRPQYVSKARDILADFKSRVIVDFGCGIGNDSIKLLEDGFDIILFDLSNVCLRFAEYRIKEAGFNNYYIVNNVAELSQLKFDTIWAMDIIEHLVNPIDSLNNALKIANVIIYDTDHAGTSGGRQPFHYDHSPQLIQTLFSQVGYTKADKYRNLIVYCKK